MKNTKKSLLASGLALLASVALLAGTTFAWFTDSVTNSGNKIQAGSLKIGLYELQDGKYVDIRGNEKPIFDYNLWEPGYSDVTVLKVANNGSLALKWNLQLIANGDAGKLGDVIDVYAKVSEGKAITSIPKGLDEAVADGYALVGTLNELMTDPDGAAYGVLYAADDVHKPIGGYTEAYAGIVLHMQETAGNEYQNASIGTTFDIVLNAAQYPYEEDGFQNPDYDEKALYPVSEWDGVSVTAVEDLDKDDEAKTVAVHSAADFAGLAAAINQGSLTDYSVTLTAHMDLGNQAWTPIGTGTRGEATDSDYYFTGTFDGAGYTIRGLNVERNLDDHGAGLFGAVKDATIKNVRVVGGTVSNSEDAAAGLVGIALGETVTIENCVTDVAVSGAAPAGILSRAYAQETIVTNCENRGDITTTGKAGGIVCINNIGSSLVITDCVNSGCVTGGTAGTAGICGYANDSVVISNCTNEGTIGDTATKYAAGIIGYQAGSQDVSITGCTNTGAVSASVAAGGIYGLAGSKQPIQIQGCTNHGFVSAGDAGNAGGIASGLSDGKIENCRNTAAIHGRFAGGVVGTTGKGEVVNCSGGTASITSPAGTLTFTGQAFKLSLQANDCAGRLIGANSGSGPEAWTKLTIDDTNGDSYDGIGAIGICGIYTSWANLEIVAGTLRGDPLAGNTTYLKINPGVHWADREVGTYICGGLNEQTRKTEWTKQP